MGGAHKSMFRTSDVLILSLCMVAFLLDAVLPLQGLLLQNQVVKWGVGGGSLGMGVYLLISSKQLLAAHSQGSEPGKESTKLVTQGLFAMSRNPLYLGNLLMILGLGFIGLPGLIILFPFSPFVFHWWLIRPEEEYLAKEFGAEWSNYCRQVPRWVKFGPLRL